MPRIEGPIIIKQNGESSGIEGKVKLPFEATGWKSTKTPKLADTSELVESESGESFEHLLEIKGVGKESVKDLERVYRDMEELKSALAEDNVPLRNDIVEKLKAELL